MHFEIFAWQILLSFLVDFQMSFGGNELKDVTKYTTRKLCNVCFLTKNSLWCYYTYSLHYAHLALKKTLHYKKFVKWDCSIDSTNAKFLQQEKNWVSGNRFSGNIMQGLGNQYTSCVVCFIQSYSLKSKLPKTTCSYVIANGILHMYLIVYWTVRTWIKIKLSFSSR